MFIVHELKIQAPLPNPQQVAFDLPVDGESLWQSLKQQYSQLQRWGQFQIKEEDGRNVMYVGLVPFGEKGAVNSKSIADVLAADGLAAEADWEAE